MTHRLYSKGVFLLTFGLAVLTGGVCLADANAQATNTQPIATVAGASLKKGLAARDPNLSAKLSSLGVSWFYTWGSKRPEDVAASSIFTPMIWGKSVADNSGLLDGLKKIAPQGDSGALLGFNEPDWKKQANMSVEKALDLWPELEATGRRLGSPAVAVKPVNGDWLPAFMAEAQKRNYRVDFITLHWYGTPDPAAFLQWVDEVHEKYGKPIWITEFAVADWAVKKTGGFTRFSVADVARFMKAVIPELEKRDFVEHYFWFSANVDSKVMGTSALFNPNGSLTEVGLIYSQF